MSIIGDYGAIGNGSISNKTVSTERKSQVFQATHDGEGRLLPSRYRSFISFSFGGKNIEDFNLIACCEGDTMTRRAYAEFEDLTTEYDIMDGLYYHGTHYKPNTLSLKLVSDDLDLKQLDEFLYWFAGGKIRELILAEHPNRAIMARVAEAPEIDVLPFEKVINIEYGGQNHLTSTTLYKGFITLDLIADMPFWYAKRNFFSETITAAEDLKEALKVSYEDMVPIADMIVVTMMFGSDKYASVTTEDTPYAIIAGAISISSPTIPPADWDDSILGYFIQLVNNTNLYWRGARTSDTDGTILGRIAGAIVMDTEDMPITIANGNKNYKFFYGGNAPSPTLLEFEIDIMPSKGFEGTRITLESNEIAYDTNSKFGYIDCFANSYAPLNNKEYSTISIVSRHLKNFDITTSNILTSYNKVRKIIYDDIEKNVTYLGDVGDTFRDLIRHPAVRAWAVNMINYLKMPEINTNNLYIKENGTFTATGINMMKNILPKFFMLPALESDLTNQSLKYNALRSSWRWNNAKFVFNAETGVAEGTFYYWLAGGRWNVVWEVLSETAYPTLNDTIDDIAPSTIRLGHASYKARTENVGDMLRSNWLIIEDRNVFKNNQVVNYTSSHPEYSHYLTHNMNKPMENVKLLYKNMYL